MGSFSELRSRSTGFHFKWLLSRKQILIYIQVQFYEVFQGLQLRYTNSFTIPRFSPALITTIQSSSLNFRLSPKLQPILLQSLVVLLNLVLYSNCLPWYTILPFQAMVCYDVRLHCSLFLVAKVQTSL